MALKKKYAEKVEFIIVDTNKPDARPLAEEYRIQYIPAIKFIDSQGNVVDSTVGLKKIEDLEKSINKIVK